MTLRSRRTRLGLVALATLVAGGLAPVAPAAAAPTTLDAARLTDSGPGLLGGYRYTVLALELDLADPDGLPDELVNFETELYPVANGSIDHDGFVVETPTDRLAGRGRAGTGCDASRARPRTAPGAGPSPSAAWPPEPCTVDRRDGHRTRRRRPPALPFPSPLTVDVETNAASAPWVYAANGSVRVVTGDETWDPRCG